MALAPIFAALFSVVVPTRMWYAPSQPDEIRIESKEAVSLVLTDFSGKGIEAKGAADVQPGKTVDIKTIYPQVSTVGTYVLYAIPKGKPAAQFVGTPLVIEVRGDKHGGTEPQVTHVQPLQYALMQTPRGAVTMVFYYDVAPNTVDSFLRLASEGFYDGLTFHRIVPGFVIQGGDPRGNGSGGPGYNLEAEFNQHKHEAGVLSMARAQDPNSAGSQFFICLGRAEHLDNQYTAFGQVTDGMKAVNEIAATPLTDPQNGVPAQPQVIDKIEVKPVTAEHNPYAQIMHQ